jgi:hypothetical protein
MVAAGGGNSQRAESDGRSRRPRTMETHERWISFLLFGGDYIPSICRWISLYLPVDWRRRRMVSDCR